MLVYGDVGVGKTRLAGSSDEIPELRPILVIDAEGGSFTLREPFPNVEIVRVNQWQELQKVFDELHSGAHDYRTIVIDSLTELQMMNMNHIMNKLQDRDEERWGKQQDGEIASMLEWQVNSKQVRKFIRLFQDLPMTTIFTSLMKEDRHKITGVVHKRPNLPGKLAIAVAGQFDFVLYYYLQKIENEGKEELARLLLTEATDTVTAKDRSNKLPKPVMINPTMTEIYKYAVEGTQRND